MAFSAAPERYRFGLFELQLDERRLLNDGDVISLRPRAFDLLAALVDRAGHLVTKDELLDRVWPKRVVSANDDTRCFSLAWSSTFMRFPREQGALAL